MFRADAVFSLYLLKLEQRLIPQEQGSRGSGGRTTAPPVDDLYIRYTIKFHVSKEKKSPKILKMQTSESELCFCEVQVCWEVLFGFQNERV